MNLVSSLHALHLSRRNKAGARKKEQRSKRAAKNMLRLDWGYTPLLSRNCQELAKKRPPIFLTIWKKVRSHTQWRHCAAATTIIAQAMCNRYILADSDTEYIGEQEQPYLATFGRSRLSSCRSIKRTFFQWRRLTQLKADQIVRK